MTQLLKFTQTQLGATSHPPNDAAAKQSRLRRVQTRVNMSLGTHSSPGRGSALAPSCKQQQLGAAHSVHNVTPQTQT